MRRPHCRALRSEVDDLVSLKTPLELLAIGYWYEDLEQVSDEEVVLLDSRAAEWEAEESDNWRGSSGET